MRRSQYRVRLGEVPLEALLNYYDACLTETEEKKIAQAMGKDEATMEAWLKRCPELQLARKLAIGRRGNREHLAEYIYGNLSPEGLEAWKKIEFWDGHESMREKVDQILAGKTMRVRQELFIHALVRSGFNMSEACRMVSINRTSLDAWGRDEGFRKLVQEIHWHKKNYFEKALIDLVAMRHPTAVLFVNRTINADRGYGEKLQIEHSGEIGLSLDDLDLDLETRKIILEAMRKKKALQAQAQGQPRALNPPGNGSTNGNPDAIDV